jgi:hypothetical protein
MTSKRAVPVWLTAFWEQRRTETAARIARAVTKLHSDGCEVTYSSICATIRAVDGISISPNTIKRNGGAYEIYVAHRRPQQRCLPEPLLTQTIAAASQEETRRLRSRVERLRRETKDALIARILRLESTVKQQNAAENALRDEIVRLSANGSSSK